MEDQKFKIILGHTEFQDSWGYKRSCIKTQNKAPQRQLCALTMLNNGGEGDEQREETQERKDHYTAEVTHGTGGRGTFTHARQAPCHSVFLYCFKDIFRGGERICKHEETDFTLRQ